jgi:hypothetical protein
LVLDLRWILIVYVLIVVVGESIVVATGLVLDRVLPLASLPVSLSLFFAVLAFGWPLAVRWTEPKHAKNVKLASWICSPSIGFSVTDVEPWPKAALADPVNYATLDPYRSSASPLVWLMSAFGGKVDIGWTQANVR